MLAAVRWSFRVRIEAVCKLVGRRLRWRRRALDLTQLEVATRCGISFQQLQKYEAGQVDLSIGRLVALANALNMPLNDILEGLTTCIGANDSGPPGFASNERTRLA